MSSVVGRSAGAVCVTGAAESLSRNRSRSGTDVSTIATGSGGFCSSLLKRVHSPRSMRPSRMLAAIKAYLGMSMVRASVRLWMRSVLRHRIVATLAPGVTA